MSLILSGSDGVSDIDGSAATPAIRGTDTNTGIFFGSDIIGFSEGGVEAMRINASGVLVTTNDASISGLTVGKGGGAVSSNTAIGATALNANTTGVGNVAVGQNALLSNTTANYNNAFGAASLYSNTTGTNNVAMGDASLYANTTGSSNTSIGATALRFNTTASNNTAVGYQAGYTNITGAGNTFIGNTAGYTSNAGANNGFNTCIGFAAGYALTTGIQNTFIGTPAVSNGAGGVITTGSYNTIIGGYNGNTGGLDIRTLNNRIVLSDGAGNIRTYFNDVGSAFFDCVDTPDGTNRRGFQVIYNTGLGDTTTLQIATTTSSTRALIVLNNSNGNVGSVGTSGSNAYYSTTSDYRLKENIAPMTGALAKVSALKPCTYTWKSSQENSQGFIAHELAEVCPQAVVGEKDAVDAEDKPVYQSIDTSFLVATLTAAIQELKAEVDSLKQQLGK